MAWFKEKGAVAAPQPTPMTVERLSAALAALTLSVQQDADGDPIFYCYINNFPVCFGAESINNTVVTASLFEYRLPTERVSDVLEWAAAFNADTHFVTAAAIVDEEGVYMRFDAPIHCAAGITEDQLLDNLDTMIVTVLHGAETYCKDMELSVKE